jgi:hypothetical protein
MYKLGFETPTWEHINTFTSLFSFIGPRRSKKKFSIVRLLASRMLPVFGCNVSSVSPNAENKWRTNVVSLDGGVGNSAFDGCRRLVAASNLVAKQIFSSIMKKTTIRLTVVPYAVDREQVQIAADMTEGN